MIRMNAAAELEGKSFAQAAALLVSDGKPQSAARRNFLDVLFGPDFWRLTGEHLLLVFVSLAASIAVGVPLGVAAAKAPRAAQWILGWSERSRRFRRSHCSLSSSRSSGRSARSPRWSRSSSTRFCR